MQTTTYVVSLFHVDLSDYVRGSEYIYIYIYIYMFSFIEPTFLVCTYKEKATEITGIVKGTTDRLEYVQRSAALGTQSTLRQSTSPCHPYHAIHLQRYLTRDKIFQKTEVYQV